MEIPYEFAIDDERNLLARGRTICSDEGDSLGAVITVSDITFIKALDKIKSEFVAEVSHELRSPLSTIHEQLALVIDDIGHGKVNEELPILSGALKKTHELISLVGDLLDLSRIESGMHYTEPRLVDVDELLGRIVDFLNTKAERKRQVLTLDLKDNEKFTVYTDPFALESIFGNLIINAINYTPKAGKICVTVYNHPSSVAVAVSYTGLGVSK